MVIARAPVRVSFGGGGTDLAAYYQAHGGVVVSATIARYCYAMARSNSGGEFRITSLDYGLSEKLNARTALDPVGPLSLPRAVLGWFVEQKMLRSGVDLWLWADVPPGTGLGSSSAMAVAIIQALAGYCGYRPGPAELAELACNLEIDRLGMPVGCQDQYASAFGGFNTIFFDAEGIRVEPIRLAPGVMIALEQRLLLFATGRRRDSAEILRQQRQDSATDSQVINALHQIKALALETRAALQAGDLDDLGRLLDQGWQAKRGLSGKISSPAIDGWYNLARQEGALGGKITGAGGGGYLLLYCPPERQAGVRAALTRAGLQEQPFDLTPHGAESSLGGEWIRLPTPRPSLERAVGERVM